MANRYWVGGTANWDGTAGSKWSTTSGGGGGAAVPTSSDDVFFDGNSGAITCTITVDSVCNKITTTGFSGSINFSANLAVNGDFTSGSGTTWGGTSSFAISIAGSATRSMTTNGVSIGVGVLIGVFDSFSGTWNLLDNLSCFDFDFQGAAGAIINTNDHNITSSSKLRFVGSAAVTANLGSSILTAGSASTTTFSITNSSLTFNAGTSTIIINDSSNSNLTFAGGGKTFHNVWFNRGSSTGIITISGSNTFAELKDTGTAAHSVKFTAGTTQTLSSAAGWKISGSAGNLITVTSTTTAVHNLSCSSGNISADYLVLSHSVAAGGATYYAGSHSTDNQSVATAGSGWIFSDAPVGPTNLKTWNGLAKASIKTINGLAIANVKSVNGLS